MSSGADYHDDTSTEHIGIRGPMDYPLHAWLCKQSPLGPTSVAAALVESRTIREAKALLAQRRAEQQLNTTRETLDAAEELVAELQDVIGYTAIHIQERWMVSKLRTEQRELWADALDAWHARMYRDQPDEATTYERWWRS